MGIQTVINNWCHSNWILSPASPTSTLFTTRIFCFVSAFSTPAGCFVFPQTAAGLQSAARGFPGSFSSLTRKELCPPAVETFRPLISSFWHLGSPSCPDPAVALQSVRLCSSGFSPGTRQFSDANLVQIIFALFFPGHCLITSSLFPLGFLCGSHLSAGSVCITAGLASVKFWCHSLDILLLLVSAFWFLSVLVNTFHVFQPLWAKSQLNSSPVYPKSPELKRKAGWCEGAHENTHKHKVNWAEASWPNP